MIIQFDSNSEFLNLIEKHFSSSENCFDYLSEITQHDKYFFRGEAKYFERSCPGTVRISELHFQESSLLMGLTGHFEDWCEEGGLELDKGQMFLQHYGLPTDLLDITTSLRIALYFAYKDYLNDTGYIAILNQKKAYENFEIFNLSEYKFLKGIQLKRPKLQEAYAIRHKAGNAYDLKQKHLIDDGVIRWFSFTKCENDQKLFSDLSHILDNTSDESILFLADYITNFCISTWQPLDLRIEVCNRLLKKIFE
jgi:hypothetical protein